MSNNSSRRARRAKQKRQNRLGAVLAILIFLLGLGILFYPVASDLWNQHRQNRLITNYTQSTAALTPEDHSALREAAREYNRTLDPGFRAAFTGRQLPADDPYWGLLNPDGSGIMGYIEIPRISVRLPIYHGTTEEVLRYGIGHLGGSSLPVGGEGTHAIVSGHRGLPSALLFSDLDQLQLGDHFSLRILGEQLLYEVDQILVVEPDEVKELRPVEGEDLVTLVTCTPYGVNTHRLLVRGHRIPAEAAEKPVQVTVTQQVVHSLGWKGKLLIGALLLFLLILLILALLRRKKKKDEPEEDRKERGSANEISYQNGSDTADASAAVPPRDGPPR